MPVLRPLPDTQSAADGEGSWTDYFLDSDVAHDSPLAWQLEQQGALVEALRCLFHGPASLARLRLWVFLTLMGQGAASLSRDEFDRLFHAVRPDALDTVVRRLRDAGLMAWDETRRHYDITPLAQQLASLLGPLASTHADGDELGGLLGQVMGAEQLGTLEAGQVQMLQAQLSRLQAEFADAIASGSEFRLREARKRYDRATRLIDRASSAITTIISNARGDLAMEKAARALGQAQSRLLAMASQFNRALQQVDRQRVTLGSTGITSTDVKRWLQTLGQPEQLLDGALTEGVQSLVLGLHELLDITEAEFERDRSQRGPADVLPAAQAAPEGLLAAVALPQELQALAGLLAQWAATPLDPTTETPAPDRSVTAALLGADPATARYTQVAYKAQLLPLLGDRVAQGLPGATGELARQPWRVAWDGSLLTLAHAELELLSSGQLLPLEPDTPADKISG